MAHPLSFILPEDAVTLRAATRLACTKAGARPGVDADRIADAVLWLAKGGLGRRTDGTLDAEEIADAVIARFWDRRMPVTVVSAVSVAELPAAPF